MCVCVCDGGGGGGGGGKKKKKKKKKKNGMVAGVGQLKTTKQEIRNFMILEL